MRILFRLWLLSMVGWLALTACSPSAGNLAVGGGSKVVGQEGGLYPPQDLSLVANTGRPQLLDSYADW